LAAAASPDSLPRADLPVEGVWAVVLSPSFFGTLLQRGLPPGGAALVDVAGGTAVSGE
jgi:hypothetical protein